jgi:hypothetical protein
MFPILGGAKIKKNYTHLSVPESLHVQTFVRPLGYLNFPVFF